MRFDAVVFDLGGVVLGSPFGALRGYERDHGLADRSLARVVDSRGQSGAWQRHERGEITFDEFCAAFEDEGRAVGVEFSAREVMARIGRSVRPRPAMLRAVRRLRDDGLRVAALTNNWAGPAPAAQAFARLREHFDVFVESHVEGMRKPDPRIYRLVLERLGTAPERTIFLDDIGRNLKPARAMGMSTIKVGDPGAALAELGRLVEIDLIG